MLILVAQMFSIPWMLIQVGSTENYLYRVALDHSDTKESKEI